MATKKKITQKQLAQELGISQPLVSMVLNGRREGISETRFNQIWKRAVESGYSPRGMDITHLQEKSPRTSREIGILLRRGVKLNLKANFFSHVYQGVHEAAVKSKTFTVFLGSEDDFADDDSLIDLIADKQLLGLIILGEIRPDLLFKIKQEVGEVVAVSARYPGFCDYIVGDEDESVEQLVDHLYGLGHRKFGWIGGNLNLGRHHDRFNALLLALRKREILLSEKYCSEVPEGDRIDGREAMASMLERLGREDLPTAIICHNGTMARGAINFLLHQQINIPQEVSIAAIDRTRISCDELPTITSAGGCPESMGAAAVDRLLALQDGVDAGERKQIILKSELIVRDSTGPV